MRLSTPLSPRSGPGLFEFLTAGMKGPGLGSGGPQPRLPPPWRRPVLRHSQPLLYLGGGGRARVPERNGVPRTTPPPLPLLMSIIQGACSRNSPPSRVLVIYLDSAPPACPAPARVVGVTDPSPPATPCPIPGALFISGPAGLARLQAAPDGFTGHGSLSGNPRISLLGPRQPSNVVWLLLLNPAGPFLPHRGGDRRSLRARGSLWTLHPGSPWN